MKHFFAVFAALAFFASPAIAADDAKEQTGQSAKKAEDNNKDSVLEKAVKSKAIDAMGNDSIIEKGAKAKVWLGDK